MLILFVCDCFFISQKISKVNSCFLHSRTLKEPLVLLHWDFLHDLYSLTWIYLWSRREGRKRVRWEARKPSFLLPRWTSPYYPLLHPPPPFFCFSEWVLIIGPLWCVWILCLHTLSQTVSGHQTDGGLCAEDTHMLLHKHPQSALLHGTCHTPMPGPSHAPLIYKNAVK